MIGNMHFDSLGNVDTARSGGGAAAVGGGGALGGGIYSDLSADKSFDSLPDILPSATATLVEEQLASMGTTMFHVVCALAHI